MNSTSDEILAILNERILEAARDNHQIFCKTAFSIAKELDVPIIEVGKAADRLEVKIRKCQLGCF